MFFKTSFILLSLSPALSSAGLLPAWLVNERGSDICGVQGRVDTDNNYFWSASKKLTSYSGCSARCAGQKRCKSFGYDDNVCMLFDESLSGNLEKDSRSDLTFYDVGCVDEDAGDTTPSVTAVRSTFSRVHISTARTTATRTATIPEPTATSFPGSNSTKSGSTSNATIPAVGSLISLRPTSTATASTTANGGDGETVADGTSDTTPADESPSTAALATEPASTLDSTPIATAAGIPSSSSSLSTNGSSIGNGTLVPLNATGLGAPVFRNNTRISV
ncbi:hypothetical protein N0V93_005321 [Gnomoniopsis smithogilvyi]|uniref:Apple domain-containing protein n=1 Tax=Gnomoniopsis smithogilvyi TaxID=1191159 RepID=A0A9W9CY14_9PEZI|nr:hypothetical protein N0V93_005321 [Gnomoniopsis smithogilvyi]